MYAHTRTKKLQLQLAADLLANLFECRRRGETRFPFRLHEKKKITLLFVVVLPPYEIDSVQLRPRGNFFLHLLFEKLFFENRFNFLYFPGENVSFVLL